MGKEQKYYQKNHSKFQRVGSKCAKAGVQFSSELIYVIHSKYFPNSYWLKAHT